MVSPSPTVTTYYRMYATCPGSVTSPTSSVATYTVSAPPPTAQTGFVTFSGDGAKISVTLSQPATCTYSFSISGYWTDNNTLANGAWFSTFSITAGSTSSTPNYLDCIDNSSSQDLTSLAGGSPNYYNTFISGLTSYQCSSTVTLILTPII